MHRGTIGFNYRKVPIPLPTRLVGATIAGTIMLLILGAILNLGKEPFAPLVILGAIAYPIFTLSVENRRKSLLRFNDQVVLIARATRYAQRLTKAQEAVKPSGVNYHFDAVPKTKAVDILAYIATKANGHVFYSGRSGVGKTISALWLTMRFPQGKVVFNFKAGDHWLGTGYPILGMQKATPNPFRDTQSFVSAFLIANPITSQGIQASYIPIMLHKIAGKSSNWREFQDFVEREGLDAKKRRDSNALAALSWIRAQSQQFILLHHGKKSVQEYVAENNNIVLDFSEIKNEQAQTFYSEVVLRELYATHKAGIVIVFDEAHRLLHKQGMSILERYLREGRSKGFTVLCSTQNMTDIADNLRNNFATQFLFNTTNSDDLTALNKIEPMLAFAASDLPPGVFCDAAQPQIHDDILLFLLCNPIEEKAEATYIQTEQEVVEAPKIPTVSEEEILELLKDRPRSPTEMGKILAQKHGQSVQDVKFRVSQILTELKTKKGIVDSMRFDLPNTDRFRVFYYLTGENISSLHDFMQNEAERELRKANYKIVNIARSGELSKPDIETEHTTVEIETGLKRKFDDLKERMQSSAKPVIIVVPNKDVKELYSKMFDKTNVTYFYDFIESLKQETIATAPREEQEEIEK